MEDITLERLLNNFTDVLQEINDIVEKKDIDAARRALEQIEELVKNDTHITLDDREDSSYDHVLHELLSKISGVIEISEEIEESEVSEEYTKLTTRITEIDERIIEINAEISEIQSQTLNTTEITKIEARITYLRKELENLNNSLSLNSRDDAIKAEIIRRLNEEIAELESRLNNRGNDEPVQEENLDDLRSQLAELEARRDEYIRYAAGQAVRDNSITELTNRISDLQNRIYRIENRDSIISEIDSEITSNEEEIARLQKELENLSNENGIEVLRTQIAELEAIKDERIRLGDPDVSYINSQIENLQKRIDEINSQNINAEPKVLLSAIEDQLAGKTIKEYFEERTGIKFDENLHELKEYDGVNDYDGTVTHEYEIVEKQIQSQVIDETKRKELEDKIKELQDRNDALRREKEELNSSKGNNNKSNVETDTRTDEEIRAEIAAKRKQLEELEAKQVEGIDITTTEEYKKIISEIAILEARLISIKSTETVLTEEQKARIDILIKERKTLIEEREKLIVRIKEITPGRKVSDRLDLGEEASRIGDKIFKTVQIRKELSERNVTREEFLEFYIQGRNGAQSILEELNNRFTELQKEVAELTSDPNSENSLIYQAAEAEVSGKEQEVIKLYEQIRNNFVKNGKYKRDLIAVGFFDTEITTIEQAKDFKTKFLEKYMGDIDKSLKDIKSQMDEQKENIEIFNREIQIIRDEQRAIEESKNMSQIPADFEKEKALRERQIRATIFGDEELEKEWNERVKRFHSHRKTADNKIIYRDAEGNIQEVEYETIEDYPEYEDDKFFLNLNEYKRYLENVTIYRNSGNDINSILDRLDPVDLAEYQRLEAEKEGSGREWLHELIGEQAEYVSTFHGFTNEHGVKYSTLKTAGSTLKAMKPVKGDLPATTKVGNAISNVFRFLGIRKPEFTKINENGERVSNIRGGLLTLATDALVIGGATAVTIAGGPLALAGTYGVAYAAKGAVTAGNVIASRVELKKHGDEIRANLPTLGHPSKDDREVARKRYYREVEGRSRFGAWLRAKNDKNISIFRKRAQETEEAIAKMRIAESDATIEYRTLDAIKRIKNNAILADKNQQTRQENARKVARDQNTYNDMVRDPDALDKDFAMAQIARNAVLEVNGKEGQDVNPESKAERTDKYVKPEEELGRTQKLVDTKLKGDSVAATAITIEEKYTARQQKQDRINRVLTAILTISGRIGFDALTTQFMKQTTQTVKDPDQVTPDQTTPDQVVPDKVVRTPIKKTEEIETIDLDTKISDLKYSDDVKLDIFTKNISGSNPKGNADIDAFAIGGVFKGKQEEISVAEDILSFSKTHVQNISNPDISNWTLRQLGEYLTKGSPENIAHYQSYLAAKGLPTSTKFEDIIVQMIKDGEIYGQAGMGGWRALTPENLTKSTIERIIGYKEDIIPGYVIPGKTIPGTVIPGGTHTVTTTEFDPLLIFDSTLRGAMPGVGVGVGEGLHEAAKQTKRVDPGNFEQNNPNLPISKKYKLAMAFIETAQRQRREQNRTGEQSTKKGVESKGEREH